MGIIFCDICNSELACEWVDLHGQGRCITCGTPYTLLHVETPEIAINEKYIPLVKRYWDTTGRHNGLGVFLDQRDNKHSDDCLAFYQWLDKQPDTPEKITEEQND